MIESTDDLLVIAGLATVGAGIWLLAGLPWTLIWVGIWLFLIGMGAHIQDEGY